MKLSFRIIGGGIIYIQWIKAFKECLDEHRKVSLFPLRKSRNDKPQIELFFN